MALNELLKIAIERQWEDDTGHVVEIKKASRVHGGDTGNCFHLVTGSGDFFLKYNENTSKELSEKEFEGLKCLMNTQTIAVPRPLLRGHTDRENFLITEYISKSSPRSDFWQIFAQHLSDMHRCSHEYFGFGTDNYIGPLRQANQPENTWAGFYAARRLEPLIRRCVDEKLLSPDMIKYSSHLYKRLPDIFPGEKPALVHGDLWGGNYLAGPGGIPYVFDPAVYYGNREMDLAMTRLFGGFDRTFYWFYEEYFPLSPGWQERISLCQLYPLLVHALLFGGGYVQQVRNILSVF